MKLPARRWRRKEVVTEVSGFLIFLTAWYLLVPAGNIYVPQLNEVVEALLRLANSGTLARDSLASFTRVMIGVFAALGIAITLAVISGMVKIVGSLLDSWVELLRPIPPIAWTPLALLVFGIGDAPAIAIVASGAFFPLWLGLRRGMQEVREQHLLAARSFGATRVVTLIDVILPSALPSAIHGLRVAIGLGWFCVVAAEMMGAPSGLGYGVQLFSLNLEIARMYGYLLVIGVLGAGINQFAAALEGGVARRHGVTASGND
jgi:ABC-type nitrate/sulfonate/bicarbonate transport system permease component